MSDLANKILSDADEKMVKAVEVAKEDFGAIRTGRAHPSMFAKIMVDYYGTFTPLSQLASVQVPEARMAVVSPYDKGAMPLIEKAIRDSDLGVNPASDGAVIRVGFPQLTEDRRKEFIKVAKTKAEESRVSVIGVWIKPGAMALTVMFRLAHSKAKVLVNPINPALDAT